MEAYLCDLGLSKDSMLETLKSRKTMLQYIASIMYLLPFQRGKEDPKSGKGESLTLSILLEPEDLRDGHQGAPFSQCVLA